MYNEGQWKKQFWRRGGDSNLCSIEYNENRKYNHVYQLSLGEVALPQPEPLFKQDMVTVNLVKGGMLTSVAWPGPNVVFPGAGIHGLWEPPLPGQQVLVGFVDGRASDPVVVQKYPYNPSQDPALEAAYFMPMTQQAHGIFDIVLGHITGSYMAFRTTLPLPGAVEINSPTILDVNSTIQMNLKTIGTMSISATISTIIESALVTLQDLLGVMKIELGPTGIKLTTGDAAAWQPNIIATCPYTGLPHGGTSAGIVLLKGG